MGKVTGFKELKGKLSLTEVPRKEYWISKKFIPITMNRF